MFLGNSDAIATASQHQHAGKSKDSGYLLQREGGSGLELSVNCAAGILIRKKLEGHLASEAREQPFTRNSSPAHASHALPFTITSHLSCDQIEKFSRQILCNDVGVEGQAAIIRGRVLVVGLGGATPPCCPALASEASLCAGLGCPASAYVVCAGVGTVGLVDGDAVDRSNLHRQILHTPSRIGVPKVTSAALALQMLAPCCSIVEHHEFVTSDNARSLVRLYDCVLDCTDNAGACPFRAHFSSFLYLPFIHHAAETRCLLSDACVLEGRPLVSGSALRWEGQITVYNCGAGPCFRCLTPVLPPAEAVGSCADSGVIGGVVGAVGCLQAVEAVKILMGRSGLEGCGGVLSARMIMYDGLAGTTRNIKLRGRQATCPVCTAASRGNADLAQLSEAYRLSACPCSAKPAVPTVTPSEFAAAAVAGKHVVVDVRRSIHSGIVALSTAIHLPLRQLCCASGVETVVAAACGADAQALDV